MSVEFRRIHCYFQLGIMAFRDACGLKRWETGPSRDHHYSLDFYRFNYIDVIFTVLLSNNELSLLYART